MTACPDPRKPCIWPYCGHDPQPPKPLPEQMTIEEAMDE